MLGAWTLQELFLSLGPLDVAVSTVEQLPLVTSRLSNATESV